MSKQKLDDIAHRKTTRQILCDPVTQSRIRLIGISKGMHCLEIGAGYGSMAIWLADIVGTDGKVVVTEISSDCLDVLSGIIKENLTVLDHNIVKDGPLDESFDLILARFVLEHIPERLHLIKTLHNMLNPGGKLLIEDADFCMIHSWNDDEFKKVMIAFEVAKKSEGTDYSWTSYLPVHFRNCKFSSIDIQSTWNYFQGGTIRSEFWASILFQEQNKITNTGMLSIDDFKHVLNTLSDKTKWFSEPRMVSVSGTK